uniref:Uncharacterized protein n=1 Tax=Plectus sambesii TaxID=2011161 RepID=A0A914XHK1_9BILA
METRGNHPIVSWDKTVRMTVMRSIWVFAILMAVTHLSSSVPLMTTEELMRFVAENEQLLGGLSDIRARTATKREASESVPFLWSSFPRQSAGFLPILDNFDWADIDE